MKERADVVVIGAGIVGCSVAHYLTLAGVRNVVVIDQGPIGDTGGSSFHAPGLCFQTNGSKLSCTLAQWSSALYRELDTPERRRRSDVDPFDRKNLDLLRSLITSRPSA